jgi:GNAT superfamily N-acetyltransferase
VTPELENLIYIRDYVPGDKNFVMATFLRGLYYGESWFSSIPKDIFMGNYKIIAEAMLNNPNNMVKVACLREDPDVILGYSLLSTDFSTVGWVFVKTSWRRQGIGRALTPVSPTTVTHLSDLGKKLLPKLNGAVFNPFKT